jgi:hypothetical protein
MRWGDGSEERIPVLSKPSRGDVKHFPEARGGTMVSSTAQEKQVMCFSDCSDGAEINQTPKEGER